MAIRVTAAPAHRDAQFDLGFEQAVAGLPVLLRFAGITEAVHVTLPRAIACSVCCDEPGVHVPSRRIARSVARRVIDLLEQVGQDRRVFEHRKVAAR